VAVEARRASDWAPRCPATMVGKYVFQRFGPCGRKTAQDGRLAEVGKDAEG
jgi:hypothetical protein